MDMAHILATPKPETPDSRNQNEIDAFYRRHGGGGIALYYRLRLMRRRRATRRATKLRAQSYAFKQSMARAAHEA